MKRNLIAKFLMLTLALVLISSLFVGCGGKAEDKVANLTGSNWASPEGTDQATIEFTQDNVTAIFVFAGQSTASKIEGPYEATDTSFTVDDPTTGNKVEFVYEIKGDDLSITSINGTAVSFQFKRQ